MTPLEEMYQKLIVADSKIPSDIQGAFEIVRSCRVPSNGKKHNKNQYRSGGGFLSGIPLGLPDNNTFTPMKDVSDSITVLNAYTFN